MSLPTVLLLILLVVLALAIVATPLRRRGQPDEAPEDVHRGALEADKEAKYREIRDAELDWRTGKLTDADFRALDRQLRAEAIEILRRIDELEG